MFLLFAATAPGFGSAQSTPAVTPEPVIEPPAVPVVELPDPPEAPEPVVTLPPPEVFPVVATPADARLLKLESLKLAIKNDGGVPLPPNLAEFVRDKQAAIQLGKALFWDMKVGSDGTLACASCHFSAGADNRARNALNPNLLRVKGQAADDIRGLMGATAAGDTAFELAGADRTLVAGNFPLVKNIEGVTQLPDGTIVPAAGNTNDVVSSQGIHFTLFQGTTSAAKDRGQRLADPVFNVNGVTTRRVEPRNTPTMINAVLNYANFWDGRANPVFNGVNPFGLQDPNAGIFVLQKNGTLATTKIALENASLASQAVGPPLSPFEMSFGNPDANNARTYAELGRKLMRDDGAVLSRQLVDPKDSVLGALSAFPKKGLKVNYRALVRQAFDPKLWNYKGTVVLKKTTVGKKSSGLQPTVDCTWSVEPPVGAAEPAPTKDGYFVQAEANFSLFVGLAIMLYESTLISDQTPFDQWMETGTLSSSFNADALAGLNLFVGKGHCVACHSGPELTGASVRNAEKGKNAIESMLNFRGPTLYDNGFYNIGVTPTTDDLGRGGQDLNGRPLAWSRQALMRRLLNTNVPFPIIGDNTINAIGENGEIVCMDTNANGFCDSNETLSAGFQRVSVDGSFKTPGLRNQELMAPYMHNGGFATLRQVVEFYNHGGNFCRTNQANLDPDIEPRGMTSDELDKLVSFLLSLTDQRVRLEQGPFDHPELFIPVAGTSEGTEKDTQRLPQVGATGVAPAKAQKPFLGLNPRDSLYSPTGVCSVSQ